MLPVPEWSGRQSSEKIENENSETKMNKNNPERLEYTSQQRKNDKQIQQNWNNSSAKDENDMRSAGSGVQEPQNYDPSRSTMPDSTPMAPNEMPQYEMQTSLSRQTEAEMMPSNREQSASRLSQPVDEAYVLPQQSDISAPRMIQQTTSGHTGSQNAFKRLRSMAIGGEESEKLPALPPPGDLGTYAYPMTKQTGKKPQVNTKVKKAYRATRCACCLATIVTLLLVACAICLIVYAILERKKQCMASTVMIIIISVVLLAIVILEWIRGWLWREAIPYGVKKTRTRITDDDNMAPMCTGGRLPNLSATPGPMANPTYPVITSLNDPAKGLDVVFQRSLYEIPQFISGLCLAVLYIVGSFLISGTMIAAGLQLEACGTLGRIAITYAAVLAMLLIMRLVKCCMSDTCHGLCHRTTSVNRPGPVPMVAVNQLHQVLPRMGGHWHTGGDTTGGNKQPMAWLANLASASDPAQQLSIIRPMPPQYSSI